MPEIMSAEELEYEICWGEISDGVGYIRSRDSAMLEKYKEAICSLDVVGLQDRDRDVLVYCLDALDSAFAEIEGGR